MVHQLIRMDKEAFFIHFFPQNSIFNVIWFPKIRFILKIVMGASERFELMQNRPTAIPTLKEI